jgi:hypothetical protein
MKLHSIHDLTNKAMTDMLVANLSLVDEPNLIKNYHPDYCDTPGNLFYILNEGRYKKGCYYILENKGQYILSAGWNDYNGIALVYTRAYITKEYRTGYLLSKYVLPEILAETTEYDRLWITCNDYNKSIYHALTLLSNGKRAGLFDSWPEIYKKFVPIGLATVNNVEQYIAEYDRTKNE